MTEQERKILDEHIAILVNGFVRKCAEDNNKLKNLSIHWDCRTPDEILGFYAISNTTGPDCIGNYGVGAAIDFKLDCETPKFRHELIIYFIKNFHEQCKKRNLLS